MRMRRKRGKPQSRFSWEAFAERYFEALNTPLSLGCYLRLKYGEHEQLAKMAVDASNYVSATDFFLDYQSVKLLSKSPLLDTKIDKEAAAKEKFLEAELSCYRTNVRFGLYGHERSVFSRRANEVIHLARRKIVNILGDVPTYDKLNFRFGPGAATGVRGETHVFNKLSASLEAAWPMESILDSFLREFPSWLSDDNQSVDLIDGSTLTFVPKDAKTDRPICIEPLLNGLYQKGVGTYLRKLLKRVGIDLDDQSINQNMASRAVEENLATIDFSSASDTISYGLVLELLPFDWFEFLEVARCPSYQFEGRWYPFEKFTSMGNAYTFELETLIFYALASATCEVCQVRYKTGLNLSVYGDDVIIPSRCVDLFQEVSSLCGFSFNAEKSFSTGLFRESCGHDYYDGCFVRPFLFKKECRDLEDQYYVANEVLRTVGKLTDLAIQARPGNGACVDPVVGSLHSVHRWVISTIPRGRRFLGPDGQGDGHLICDLSIAVNQVSRHKHFDAWKFRTVISIPKKVALAEEAAPQGYASYFLLPEDAVTGWPLYHIEWFKRQPATPPKNGEAYSIRNHTVKRTIFVLQHGYWPSCPSWTAKSIALVERT